MRLFELIYYAGYRAKRAYDLRRRRRLPSLVISVGNITAGGTGKTPLTIALAREASKRGFSPSVLTRGYKGKLRGPCLVSTDMNEEEVGDEPLLMAGKLGDIPVIKGRDRYEAGMFALDRVMDPSSVMNLSLVTDLPEGESLPHKRGTVSHKEGAVPLFILDDGFQHWRLQRDKDVLLIDARNPFDRRKLLPVGLLREPIREIRRADIIVLTKGMGSDNQTLMREIRRYNPRARVFVSDHIPSYVLTSAGERKPLDWLSGKEVYAFCGIADPESFRAALGKAGAVLRGFKAYRDHYRYGKGDLGRMISEAAKRGARWIITTEKDIMRLKSLGLPENLLALGIDVTVEEGFYEEVFEFSDKKFPEVLW